MLRRACGYILAATFFAIPLFPAFIMLANVSVPGISVVPLPLTYALLAVVGVFAIVVLTVVLQTREPVPLFGALAVWFGAAVLATLLGFNPAGGALFLTIFAFGILWYVAVMRFYGDPGVAALCLRAFVLSGALAALAAIVMVMTKTPAYEYTVGHGRAIGTFILPGELAGYLLVYVPVAFGVARATTSAALRVLALAGVTLGVVAFVLTYSRAGEIGLAAALAFYLVLQGRRAGLRLALFAVAAVAAGVLLAFNAHHNPSENYTRLSIWAAALRIIERFPLTGVGLFQFATVYQQVRLPDGEPTAFHAHSFLLTTAAEMGLAGVAAVLYAWTRFAALLRARIARAQPAHAAFALAVAAGLAGTWVQGLIDTVSIVIFGLWLPFMAVALCGAQWGLAE